MRRKYGNAPLRLSFWKQALDKVMVVVAIVGPLATLPQVFQVFSTRDVEGLSMTTWLAWVLLSVIWALYGLVHKEMPIVVSNIIYVILQGAVVLAIVMYN